jgi:putative tricarboxylic transport membrane protein
MTLPALLRRLSVAATIAFCLLPAAAPAQTWKPAKNVELVVPFAPGSGMDVVARSMHGIWTTRRLFEGTSTVVNKSGGGGNLGLLYMSQHAGDPHYLAVASATVLTNQIVGIGKLGHADFTPVGILLAEHLIFAVRADSPMRTGADLVARLKQDPASVSLSVGSAAGNVNHIAAAMVAKSAGVDPKRLKVVVFGSAGEGMTALLGGHVDVSISSLGVIVPQVEAGKLRALAVTAPQRLAEPLASVPTWKEQGVAAQLSLWRGIFATKGAPAEAVAYWEDVVGKVAKSDEWQAQAKKNLWDATFRGARDSRALMDADYAALRSVLTDLGMAKQ